MSRPEPARDVRAPMVIPPGSVVRARRLPVTMHRALMLAAIAPVLGVVGHGAPRLLWEFTGLHGEWERERAGRVIGYQDISPKLDFSQPPSPWAYDEGGRTRLWAGWFGKSGHEWFEFPSGELDPGLLSFPTTRDVVRAIDVPIVEMRGNDRWERLQDEAEMYELESAGVWTAYPVLVLQKVLLVNDEPGGRPAMVLYRSRDGETSTKAFAAEVPGEGRLTFGTTGYGLNGRDLLYDRATRSLWVDREAGLEAVAGKLRGTVLPHLKAPVRTTWGQWSEAHPGGRLIVGADRKGGIAAR